MYRSETLPRRVPRALYRRRRAAGRRLRDHPRQRRLARRLAPQGPRSARARSARAGHRSVAQLRPPQGADDRAGPRPRRAGLPDRLRPRRRPGLAADVPRARCTASGADVVYGVQEERKGDWFERTTGQLFFSVFNRMLTHPIPVNVVTARLMTRALRRRRWSATGARAVPGGAVGDHRLRAAADRGAARAAGRVSSTPPASASRCSPTRSRRSATGRWSTSSRSAWRSWRCRSWPAPSCSTRASRADRRARLGVDHGVDLVSRRAHHLLRRRHRHVPGEDLHGDQARPYTIVRAEYSPDEGRGTESWPNS